MSRKRKSSIAADVVRLGLLAPMVVGQRLGRMAAATPGSSRSDAAEWQRMTSEKWFATQESWFAAAIAWQQQLLGASLLAWSPWSRVSPLDWWKQRQVEAENVGAAALTPIVRRVANNARRLSRRS